MGRVVLTLMFLVVLSPPALGAHVYFTAGGSQDPTTWVTVNRYDVLTIGLYCDTESAEIMGGRVDCSASYSALLPFTNVEANPFWNPGLQEELLYEDEVFEFVPPGTPGPYETVYVGHFDVDTSSLGTFKLTAAGGSLGTLLFPYDLFGTEPPVSPSTTDLMVNVIAPDPATLGFLALGGLAATRRRR